jgi:Septum formation initiator
MRFGPALRAFLLCLFIGGSGVGYVWQKNQIFELGKQMKQRELRLKMLDDQNKQLEQSLALLQRPAFLNERIKNLGLVQPSPSQIWRLPEPSSETQDRLPASAEARMASAQ